MHNSQKEISLYLSLIPEAKGEKITYEMQVFARSEAQHFNLQFNNSILLSRFDESHSIT